MNRALVAAVFVFFNGLMLSAPVLAQAGPPVNANLKEALTLIPIPGIKDAVGDLFNQLKKTDGGDYMAKTTVTVPGVGSLPLQLYFFGDIDRQAIVLVVNTTIKMPGVFNNSAWKKLAGTTMTDPMFSVSTVDFSLEQKDMPAEFRQVVANSYFNVDSLDFTSGFQVAGRVHIGGIMKTVMEVGMGVPVQQFTMRAGVVSPMPTNPQAMAGLAATILADMKNVGNMAKESPEFFAEFQLAPGKTVSSPLGMGSMTLTDATFSINNKGTVGYKGNMSVQGGKKFITFFETPLNPAGAMDLLDFKFGMTAQSLTLEDLVNIAIAMETQLVPGGTFIKDIPKYKETLRQVLKPLATFQLRNPKPVGEYKFGDRTKPFPPLSSFNLLVLGPTASVDDSTGKTIQGPYLKAFGNATILGQQFGSMDVYMGSSGMHARASQRLSLKLGPLGRQTIAMAATADIELATQSIPGRSKKSIAKSVIAAGVAESQAVTIGLHGSVLGRDLDISMSQLSFSLDSPATCATPFSLSTDMAITPNMNVDSVLEGLPAVNVDPGKLKGCIGEELEKAYKWIASTGKDLGGYTAHAANQELNKISNAAAEEAAREYERVKDAARDQANKSASDAMKAFNDAGNTFKKFGKKKRHKAPPDPRMEATVFDWDYYYDNQRDVRRAGADLAMHWRDNGIREGRRGSPEFDVQFYLARYIDVRQACGSDNLCAVKHWVTDGVDEGRQGSADVAVASYLNRYGDLQQAFGKDGYPEALDHLMNAGPDRNGRPDSNAPAQVSGPKQIGGDGGGRWHDYDTCAGQYVTGFRVRYGDRLDAVQFHYNGHGWAGSHGKMNTPRDEVMLAAGEYIVQVDYRSGSRVDSVSFKSNRGRTFGPYGGRGGGAGTYTVTPGEKLGCMAGRSGDEIDKLLFSSTGPR
jgi:hypothetical protein